MVSRSIATACRDDLGEQMHELRHRAGDRELGVAVGPTDERISGHRQPSRHSRRCTSSPSNELVLTLDVGHVGDEVDAAVSRRHSARRRRNAGP